MHPEILARLEWDESTRGLLPERVGNLDQQDSDEGRIVFDPNGTPSVPMFEIECQDILDQLEAWEEAPTQKILLRPFHSGPTELGSPSSRALPVDQKRARVLLVWRMTRAVLGSSCKVLLVAGGLAVLILLWLLTLLLHCQPPFHVR